MSYRIEEDIVTTVMHHPALTHKIGVSPNWFQNRSLSEIYRAISKYPQLKENIAKWATIAHDFGFRGNDDWIAKLNGRDSSIKDLRTYISYTKTLYKQFLNNQISLLGAMNRQKPSAANLLKIKSCIKQLNNIADDTDSTDHAPVAFKSIVHDTEHSKPTGIKTYKNLDHVLAGGLYPGCLLTIGASTGVGKTSYAINLAFQIMEHDPEVRVDYFTEEMPSREIADRFMSRTTGVSNYDLRDPYDRIKNPQMMKLVQQSAKAYSHSNLHIYDKDFNLDEITSTIRQDARNRKPNSYVAIIDYIGLISTNDPTMPRYLQVGEITRAFKILTNDLKVPVIQITQLNRNIFSRDDPTPQLSDIRESGSVAQDSNVVVLLYKDKRADKALETQQKNLSQIGYIIADIAKNRSGMGEKLEYLFYKSSMRMTPVNPQSVRKMIN